MNSALATIAFLSRSPHRIAVLEALIDAPRDRAELRDATDASSSTLGHILNDFADREWITRTDRRYEVTPMGELVGREFVRLVDTVETVEGLHEAVAWLPIEEMDVELDALGDATITTATESNPFLPVLTMAGRLAAGEDVRLLVATAIPQVLGAIQEAVHNGSQSFEGVITHEALDAIVTDPRMETQFRDLLDAASVTVRRCDSEIPHDMAVVDDRVLIAVSDDRRVPRALVETDDECMLSWAESTCASFRRDAETIDADRLVA